jgi:hypothetical protein
MQVFNWLWARQWPTHSVLLTWTACRNWLKLAGSKYDGNIGYCAGKHSSWQLLTGPTSNGLWNVIGCRGSSAFFLKCLYLGQFCISFVVMFCHACTDNCQWYLHLYSATSDTWSNQLSTPALYSSSLLQACNIVDGRPSHACYKDKNMAESCLPAFLERS